MILISLFSDFNRISIFQVWGCGLPKEVDEQAIEEYQRELRAVEKGAQQRVKGPSAAARKSSSSSDDGEAGDAKKPKPKRENRNDNWDVDKQLLEMAGFEFDRKRRVAPPPPPEED